MPTTSPERSQDIYEPGFFCESVDFYRKGGFHPVHIGDIIHEQYEVVNKLGYGAYATVWLVKDVRSGRYASLKILAAEATNNASEVAVLRRLQAIQADPQDTPGAEFVMKVFDDFTVDGPNGTHQCIVTEVLGPHLATELDLLWGSNEESGRIADAKYPLEMKRERYPIDTAKQIVAQIALGVAYLHRVGIVHGDLHLGNVLLYAPEMERWSVQDIQKYFKPPRRDPLIRKDGKPTTSDPHVPRYVVPATPSVALLELCAINTTHIKICDFGEAFLLDNEPKHIELHTPAVYAAPEIIFRDPVTPAVDVWRRPSSPEVVRGMVVALGKLPDRWWSKWGERSEWFDDEGVLIASEVRVKRGLLDNLSSRMGGEEIGEFEKLVRRMVCYQVEDRISAEGVVQSIPADWIEGGAGHMKYE
ncbi:kinase-like domain-containing protein [Hygrophoropsis aurantiaca]|uniref:Kinase-like domain-containing protein n=1 Tax=Hygrophoropsis aurantiaca TaxID=72124 RepID=A0ACB7ZYN6_9AGAM|nr:kinase-like domain-containing protein [Hygrophoropsis aurantiaca]